MAYFLKKIFGDRLNRFIDKHFRKNKNISQIETGSNKEINLVNFKVFSEFSNQSFSDSNENINKENTFKTKFQPKVNEIKG